MHRVKRGVYSGGHVGCLQRGALGSCCGGLCGAGLASNGVRKRTEAVGRVLSSLTGRKGGKTGAGGSQHDEDSSDSESDGGAADGSLLVAPGVTARRLRARQRLQARWEREVRSREGPGEGSSSSRAVNSSGSSVAS